MINCFILSLQDSKVVRILILLCIKQFCTLLLFDANLGIETAEGLDTYKILRKYKCYQKNKIIIMKIYLSYTHQDKEIAFRILDGLKHEQFNVWEDSQILPGDEWEKKILENLDADVFILVVTKKWIDSDWIQQKEFPLMLGYVEKDPNKVIIPIVPSPEDWSDNRLSFDIKKRLALIDSNPNILLHKLIVALKRFEGGRIAESVKEQEKKQVELKETAKKEKTVIEFVEDTISFIEKREKKLKLAANIWYIVGFLSLLLGIGMVVYLTIFVQIESSNWTSIVIWGIKSSVVLILLLSASKYSFNLAKSFMTESLRNADRVYSISFGKLYVQSVGGNISGAELKDIFRDWNTDKSPSIFASLNSNDYDPKLIELIFKVSETIKDAIPKK